MMNKRLGSLLILALAAAGCASQAAN